MNDHKRIYQIGQVFAGIKGTEVGLWTLTMLGMLGLLYVADESVYLRFFADASDSAEVQEYYSYLFHHGMTLIVLGLPLLLMRPLGMGDYGFELFTPGDWRWGLKWTLITCIGMIIPTWVSSYDPAFLKEYPLTTYAMGTNSTPMWLFLGSYILYYIGWEAFFRGFIGYGFLSVDYRPFVAMMIQVSLSCIIHIGKPEMELIGAIPGGVIMGLLAYRSGSLLWPLLFHFFIGIINTFFCWWHQPMI